MDLRGRRPLPLHRPTQNHRIWPSLQRSCYVSLLSFSHFDFADILSIVFQTVGGAFTISAAQTAFINRLVRTARHTAPGVSPLALIGTGATDIRRVFPAELVPGIVEAYMAGVKVVFALSIGIVAGSVLMSALLKFKRLNVEAAKAAGGAA